MPGEPRRATNNVLAFYKEPAVAHSAGRHVLFLPPDFPDFNPLEQVFSTLKKNRIHQDAQPTVDDSVQSCGLFF